MSFGRVIIKKMMTWVLVVRPSKGIEYQIYDGREHRGAPRRKKKTWTIAVLRDAGITVLSNVVWYLITTKLS